MGEILVWWGVFIVACSLPNGWKTIYAPIFISLLLRYVSGVPLLEKKQSKHPEWEAYAKKTTTMLFPWPPKN